MSSLVSVDRLRFLLGRLRERLWVKPLAVCLVSIAAAFAARLADRTDLGEFVPSIAQDSVESLLSVMAASMLVIATFAVASMVSAYASASSAATPRSLSLVIADDVSQNALSTFIGAFIFSIVALTALKNDYYAAAGIFTLFALTIATFATVILTFVRWVDQIARLGRLGTTIDKVETATLAALTRRRKQPRMGGRPMGSAPSDGVPVFGTTVGYVQHVDTEAVQGWAEANGCAVVVAALPGTFVAPDRALAHVVGRTNPDTPLTGVVNAFQVGHDRLFDDDPRFGLVVLSEIAGRALSPAVNDPGTAIDVVGTLTRLFVAWYGERPEDPEPKYDRVFVPELAVGDLCDDAFLVTGRDGAGAVEVVLRLLKALRTLSRLGNDDLRDAAERHARLALARAEARLDQHADRAAVAGAAEFAAG